MKNKLLYVVASALMISMNFSSPITTFASQEDVSAVTSAIDSLPAMEDLDASYADMVKNVWIAYNELTTAEKIAVPNSEKLFREYNQLVNTGVLKDEKREQDEAQKELESQRANEQLSQTDEIQVTDYTFEYNSSKPVSIVMRYTTDADGDEKGDVPGRITLTSPQANTYPIANTNTKLSDDGLIVGLNWEDNFVQMDFANASNGNWTISTSIPCTFTAIDYAGARQDITPNGEQGETPDEEVSDMKTDEEVNEPIAEEDKKSGNNILGILGIVVLIGLVGGLIVLYIKFWPKGDGHNNEEKEKQEYDEEEMIYGMNEQRPMSDEEIIAQMRAEYEESLAKEREMDEFNNTTYKNDTTTDDEYTDLYEITQEDLDNDETIEEYTEGETGLLSQTNKPSNSFFDDEFDF